MNDQVRIEIPTEVVSCANCGKRINFDNKRWHVIVGQVIVTDSRSSERWLYFCNKKCSDRYFRRKLI